MLPGRDDIRPSPRLGWLVAVLPVDARRFRTGDPELAAFLAAAGAELVDAGADVEIGRVDELAGDAGCAVVLLQARDSSRTAPRAMRAVQRLGGSAGLRLRIAQARRALRRHGYADVAVVGWERHVRLGRNLSPSEAERKLWHRFPLRAAVVGRRELDTPTAVEAAAAQAADSLERRIDPDALLLGSSGVVLALAEDVLMRVSTGPAAGQLEKQRLALDDLARARPGPAVSERVPWVLGHGRVGLAAWSLEGRLPGTAPAGELSDTLVDDCLDFLVGLHEAGTPTGHAHAATVAHADALAAWCGGDAGRHSAEIGRRIARELAGLPLGFAHGDFWSGNLLVGDGRLWGVVDWPAAGPNRLPMLDLLHLRVNALREETGREVGAVLVEDALPRARAGGDALDRDYLRRLGLELSARQLEALLAAYWLEEIAHDLLDVDRDPHKLEAPAWRRANVESVLAALEV